MLIVSPFGRKKGENTKINLGSETAAMHDKLKKKMLGSSGSVPSRSIVRSQLGRRVASGRLKANNYYYCLRGDVGFNSVRIHNMRNIVRKKKN